MIKNIQKEQFILLCDELEKGTINLEQFKVLSNETKIDNVEKILEVMKMEDLVNKEEVFMWLILFSNSDNEFDHFYNILHYPIYRHDLKRQIYVFNRLKNREIEKVARLLQYDFYFNDDEFLKKIPSCENKEEEDRYAIFAENAAYISMNIINEEDSHFYEQEQIQNLSKRLLLEVNDYRFINSFVQIMHLEEIVKEPIWFDYLIKIANYKEFGHRISECIQQMFEKLIINNKLEKVTQKLKEIDKLEKEPEEKEKIVRQFIENISKLDDMEMGETPDEYFDFLMDKATSMDSFYYIRRLVEYASKNNLSVEQISNLLDSIEKIEYTSVKSLGYTTFINNPSLINDSTLSKLEKSNYDEANAILTEEAIKQNDQEFIEESKTYFGEILPNEFVNYINTKNMTKEKLLKIRDEIIDLPSTFNSAQQTFIVEALNNYIQPEKPQTNQTVKVEKEGLLKRLIKKFNK